MTFHIGQEVQCVSRFPDIPDHPYPWPACVFVGGVYVVRDSVIICNFNGLYLEEYLGPRTPEGLEVFFDAQHFRPVVEKKTDITVFTALLNTKQREHEFTS